MKYYKDQLGKVHAFELDGTQDKHIAEDMVSMSDDEIDRHLYPEKYPSDEDIKQAYIETLKPLNRRQFMLTLVEFELDDEVELAISNIEDVKLKKTLSIEYKDALTFERFSESVLTMASLLQIDEDRLDNMWRYAMKL